MFYACKCSLDLAIAYRKNIQSPAVTGVVYREFFVTRLKREETTHIPGDYLMTHFSFGRFIRQENPSYWFCSTILVPPPQMRMRSANFQVILI